MPKKNRIAIYELLFKEGVMVAKKDVHLAKHPELADKNVPNLHVMKAMQVRRLDTGFHIHRVKLGVVSDPSVAASEVQNASNTSIEYLGIQRYTFYILSLLLGISLMGFQ